MLRPSPPAMNQPWLSQLSEQKNIRLSPWQVWAIIQVLVGCLVARCCKKLQLPGVDLGFPDTYLRGSTRCLFLPFLSQFSNLLLVSHRTHLTIVHSDLKDNLHQCTHLGHSKSFHSVCLVVCRGVSLSKLPFLACKKQTVRCPRRAACCSWWNKKSAQGAAKQINFFVGSIELLAWKLRVSWCQLIEFCNHICQIGTAWHACLSLKILKERDCTEGNRVWW